MVEILYIVIIALSSAGVGLTLLRLVGPTSHSRAEELVFSIGLGLGSLALSTLILGLVGLLYEPPFYVLLAVGLLFGRKELVGIAGRLQGRLFDRSREWDRFFLFVIIITGISIAFNLLRALMPPHGAVDPLAYHLALPSLYLSKHYLSFERTLTGALYADNIGMLYTAAISLRGPELAQVFHWFMGAMTGIAIWCFCRDCFNSQVGIIAAAVFFFTPVFMFYSPLAYVDVGVAFFQFLSLWVLFKWVREGGNRTLLLMGIFTGLAMGSKHTALFLGVSLGLVILLVLLYKREGVVKIGKSLFLFCGIALLLALPWYLRAWIHADNPVWPVANHFFSGLPYGSTFSVSRPADVVTAGWDWERISDLFVILATSLWEWAWNEQLGWQKATGIYYLALVPISILHWRRRSVRWLILCSVAYYAMIVLYIDGNPRYSIAFFALLSVLAGWGAVRLSNHQLTGFRFVFRLTFLISLLCSLAQSYALSYPSIQFALSRQGSEQFLRENEGNYKAFSFINNQLPQDAKVLLQGIVKGFYCQRDYMWDHPYQRLLQYGEYSTAEEMLTRMQELGITHIVRMIHIPPGRTKFFPQYFMNPQHEEFRKKFLKLLYRDGGYVVFEIAYPS